MNSVSLALFFLATGVAFLLALWLRATLRASLPPVLRRARLVLAERLMLTEWPVRIAGKPDRVYRLPDGRHVPVERKNRDGFSVYETDRAQLSLQAWQMRQLGKKVADFGYVLTRDRRTKRVKWVPVALYDEAACVRLVRRYLEVIEGRAEARKNSGPKCKSCGHRVRCQSDA